MTYAGDEYECDVCGGIHIVAEASATDGVPAAMGRQQFAVECPESGTITWDE
jgi:hypothetical protein